MDCILDPKVLEQMRITHTLQPYRIRQIEQEIFHNSNVDFDSMTTLSKDLRNILNQTYEVIPLKLIEVQECKETSKFLFETSDGNVVETVLMYHFRTDKET